MLQYVCSLKRGNFKVGGSGDTVREVIVVMPINNNDGNANFVIMMGITCVIIIEQMKQRILI
jgi:hypothetical protein